jgi:hypothetical protein
MYMTVLTLLFILVFLIGLYFYSKQPNEGFIGQPRCPNILIQKGSRFYLYNSKVAKVPGVNPVEFENLEDYTEFLEWQRSQGIRCPVLYLQETYDAQGNAVFKARPSVSELQGGIPSNTSPSNTSPSNTSPSTMGIPNTLAYADTKILMDITKDTQYHKASLSPSDQISKEQGEQPISPDPMDPNWGGAEYTQSLVDKGFYAENEVSLRV